MYFNAALDHRLYLDLKKTTTIKYKFCRPLVESLFVSFILNCSERLSSATPRCAKAHVYRIVDPEKL